MRVYTSYFGNSRALTAAGLVMISIARYTPKWYHGICLQEVAPLPAMLGHGLSDEQYTALYHRNVLLHIDPRRLLRHIATLSGGRDVALCCYEKPGDFCHRHLLAQWLTERTGVKIEEYVAPQKKAERGLFD